MVKRKRSEQREKSRKTDKPGQQNNRIKFCKRAKKKENLNAKKTMMKTRVNRVNKIIQLHS